MFLCNPMLAEQTTKKEKRTRGKKKKKRKALSLPPHIHSRLYQTGGYSWLFINGSQGEMFADKTNTFFSFFFFFKQTPWRPLEGAGDVRASRSCRSLPPPVSAAPAAPQAQPPPADHPGVWTPQAASSEPELPLGAQRGLTLHLAVGRGEEGDVQGAPGRSRHKMAHWSLWEPVARSPRHLVFFFFFWLFSGICCLFWEGGRKENKVRHKQPAGWLRCCHPEPWAASRKAP